MTCPTVRFGRTELNIPVITVGGMRQQQTWRVPEGMTLEDVKDEVKENFQGIVDRAMEIGMNHFETASGYGSSEMQFGEALKKYPRESFILQTKVAAKQDAQEFRTLLEQSFSRLQTSYLDLFAFHGINKPEMLDWILKEGGCLEVVEEYRSAGKIRHVGFSTHAYTELIVSCIETGKFDYVNLHYHQIGSYTASGTDQNGTDERHSGNLSAVEAASKQDMGVFIISPNDKGGMLYKPPNKLVEATAPEGVSPMAFNMLWLLSHDPPIHTLSVGAARPTDLDEPLQTVGRLEGASEIVGPIEKRLRAMMVDANGEEWLRTWWKGLPGVFENPSGVFVPHIVWLHTLLRGYGMFDFCKARYATLLGNVKQWKATESREERLAAWSYTPGLPFLDEDGVRAAVSTELDACPHKEKVLSILSEMHDLLAGEEKEERPEEWKPAYDMQPWIPFPERPAV